MNGGSGREQARRLQKANPQLRVVNGSKHIKLMLGPRLVGILPYGMRAQGMNPGLKARLRRAGLKVPS
jgi:hypothetical protein